MESRRLQVLENHIVQSN